MITKTFIGLKLCDQCGLMMQTDDPNTVCRQCGGETSGGYTFVETWATVDTCQKGLHTNQWYTYDGSKRRWCGGCRRDAALRRKYKGRSEKNGRSSEL